MSSYSPTNSISQLEMTVKRTMAATLLTLVAAFSAWGQEHSTKPEPGEKRTRWQKYVNKEFGFSLSYPDTYQPSRREGVCGVNGYDKWLLCLVRRDDPSATIDVSIITSEPFHSRSGAGGLEFSKEKFGHHIFYCGMQGSMGVGYVEQCIYNLRNKTLEFDFCPTISDDPELIKKMLKTLRTPCARPLRGR